MLTKIAIFSACILSFCLSTAAKTKHAPLPDQILQGKTAYIDNQTKIASLGDRAYDEMSKWGRFKIVQKRDDADLIFVLSASSYVTGYRTDSTGTTRGNVDDDGNVQLSHNASSQSQATTVSYTYLTAIDPKTGATLWSDGKQWGNLYSGFHSATRSLVKELRKRIEEQEADGKSRSK